MHRLSRLSCKFRYPTDYTHPELYHRESPLLRGENLPLRLCQICRFWRRLVLNTPELWSSFTLHCKDSVIERTVLEAEVWFSLSQSHLLMIDIELTTDNPTESQSALFGLFLSRLSQNIHRIRRLEIYLRADSTWEPALFQIIGFAGDTLQTMLVSIDQWRDRNGTHTHPRV